MPLTLRSTLPTAIILLINFLPPFLTTTQAPVEAKTRDLAFQLGLLSHTLTLLYWLANYMGRKLRDTGHTTCCMFFTTASLSLSTVYSVVEKDEREVKPSCQCYLWWWAAMNGMTIFQDIGNRGCFFLNDEICNFNIRQLVMRMQNETGD